MQDPESEISVGTDGLGGIAVSLLPAGTAITTVAQGVVTTTQITGDIIDTVKTADSIHYTLEHIEHLRHINENAKSSIHQQALSYIDEQKRQSRATLDQEGYFQPTIVGQLDDIRLLKDDSPQRLDVRDYFSPDSGNYLTYIGRSNDISVVVAHAERSGSSVIIITPKDVGTASVTVDLINSRNLSVSQSFTVTVEPSAQQAQRPEPVGTIPPQNLIVDGPPRPVDVAPYFSSQSSLTYAVESNPRGIVTESISGSRVTITPLQVGSTSVVVTASDRNDRNLYAIQTIPVSVRSDGATIVRPPSDPTFTLPATSNPIVEGLGDDVAVIVQNTEGQVLNIRSNPWVDNNNKIGSVRDGATGIITDGPQRNGGFTWWKIDWDRENTEGWSVEAFEGSQLLFPRPPDLEIRPFNVSDDEVEPGETFTLEATVRNNGPSASAATEIFFYYKNIDENTPRVAGNGKLNVPSLREGRSREVTLRVEAPMIPGDYEYGAVLPPDIPDTYDEDIVDPTGRIRLNNTDNKSVEVISSPDLIVESILANKSTVDPGEAFRLEAVVRNQGIGEPARNATLQYYRSSDANISESDTEVGDDTVTRSNLDTNGSGEESISLTAPIEPGVYYYGACVDLRYESNTRNNCSSAVAITVRDPAPEQTPDFPDLVVSIPTLSTNTLAPGQSFTLETTVRNQGVGPAPATTLRGYRSPTATVSTVDTEVGAVDIGFLRPGNRQTARISLTAPVAAGTYSYGVCVESVSNERNTGNNCSLGIAITVENLAPVVSKPLPAQTLVVGNLTVVDVAPYFSDPNQDTLTYTASSETPELVAVEMMGLSGARLNINPLAAGDVTITVAVSDGEFTATQPLSVSVTGTISPDLIVESISLIGEATLAPGDSFTLSVTVRNRGTAKSQSTILRYYAEFGEIGKRNVRRLSPNQAQEVSITLEASDETGTYYYDACVSKVHGESNTDNNCSTRIAITVGTPANQVPVLVGTVAPRTLRVGGTSEQVDVKGYFQDPDADTLTYKASSDNAGVVSVSVSGSHVTLTPEGEGDASVAVTASDGKLSVTQTISVSVTAGPVTPPVADKPVTNRSPVSVGTISHRTLTIGKGSEQVDVKGYFQDPDADTLTYKASSDNAGVVSVSVSGAEVTLTPKGAKETCEL